MTCSTDTIQSRGKKKFHIEQLKTADVTGGKEGSVFHKKNVYEFKENIYIKGHQI